MRVDAVDEVLTDVITPVTSGIRVDMLAGADANVISAMMNALGFITLSALSAEA